MALSRKQRLRSKVQISRIFKNGRRTESVFFSIRYLPSTDNEAHLSIIVPMRISKKAVIRNKTKRRIAEILKEQDTFRIPLNMTITVTKPILGKTHEEIKSELENVIKLVIGQVKSK